MSERVQRGPEAKNPEREFHFEEVEIGPGEEFAFDVRVGKEPIEIQDGDFLGVNKVEVKFQDETLGLLKEAERLRDLPEEQRLEALVDLVRSKLAYPYVEVMEEAQTRNPELTKWFEKRFGKNPSIWKLELNEFLKKGYGDCKIMSAAYLAAAQSAGLRGICGGNPSNIPGLALKNISRPDNGRPIFKSVEVNRDLESTHAWVEIQLSDGRWIPVDPTAKMIGIGEMLNTFKEAGYNIPIYFADQGLPNEVELDRGASFFEPGEAEKDLHLQLKPASPYKNPKTDRYSGNIDLTLSAVGPYDSPNEKKMMLDFKE